MSWKKVNLFEHFRQNVFIDEYGSVRLNPNEPLINDQPLSYYYRFDKGLGKYRRCERFHFNNEGNSLEEIKKLFELQLARHIPGPRSQSSNYINSFYEHDGNVLSEEEVGRVEIKKISINFNLEKYSFYQSRHTSFLIELESIEDIDKYTCWIAENNERYPIKTAHTYVIFSKLKVGDEFFLDKCGKVKVLEMKEYTNKDDIVCEVIDSENNKHIVKTDSIVLHFPYEKIPCEYEVFNQSFNELKLSPFITHNNTQSDLYNVYWNKIEQASCYHVILYKLTDERNEKRVLQIADYEIDRNTCYLALDKLLGGKFVFKVKAEDRSGNIIAESRGIIKKTPQYFTEDGILLPEIR